MASQSVLLGSLTSRIKGDAYRSGVKVGDRLFYTIEVSEKGNEPLVVV